MQDNKNNHVQNAQDLQNYMYRNKTNYAQIAHDLENSVGGQVTSHSSLYPQLKIFLNYLCLSAFRSSGHEVTDFVNSFPSPIGHLLAIELLSFPLNQYPLSFHP